MSRQRFLTLLVAALLAISGALYLSNRRDTPRDPHGVALLPALAAELNTVTALSVRRASATPTATIHLKDGRWTVAERGDYPADVPKMRKLLLALSDAKIVEEKTSNPASFPVIGVEDPSLPGAAGAEVSITARDGTHAVIVGKPAGAGNFARRNGENLSYSVESGISFETEPRFWIESKLIDAPAGKIQSIEVKPAAGPAYTLRRAAAGNATSAPAETAAAGDAFTLEGVPAGRQAVESAALAPSPTLLSELTADDVAAAGDIDFSKPAVATVTLSGGDTVTITGAVNADKHWILLSAGKDAALNAKSAGRAFQIAAYQFDAIFRPVDQLLVPKTPPAAPAKPSAKASSKKKALPSP